MKTLTLAIAIATMTGCAALNNDLGYLKSLVSGYCAQPPEARLLTKAVIRQRTAPHTIAIDCGSE